MAITYRTNLYIPPHQIDPRQESFQNYAVGEHLRKIANARTILNNKYQEHKDLLKRLKIHQTLDGGRGSAHALMIPDLQNKIRRVETTIEQYHQSYDNNHEQYKRKMFAWKQHLAALASGKTEANAKYEANRAQAKKVNNPDLSKVIDKVDAKPKTSSVLDRMSSIIDIVNKNKGNK